MATNIGVCSICDQQNVNTPSVSWCQECDEPFCASCETSHGLMKATRLHETIPIEQHLKISSIVSDTPQFCQEHNAKLVLFCQKHDEPICLECIKEHATCGNVISLKEILDSCKSSEGLASININLEDSMCNVQKMKNDREENKTSLLREKAECVSEIQAFRNKMNRYLDQLESRIVTEADCTVNNALQEIQCAVDDLICIEGELHVEKTALNDILVHASEIQKFFYLRKIQEKLLKTGKEINHIFHTKLETISFAFTLRKHLQDMMTTVNELGCLKLDRDQTDVKLTLRENEKAQLAMPSQIKNINELNVERISVINVQQSGHAIRGCCVLNNGDVVFTDHAESNLVRFLMNSNTNKLIPVLNGAFDVTHIGNKVVVSSGDNEQKKRGVSIIDLDTYKEERFIKLPSWTLGVTSNDQHVYCCVYDHGIYSISVGSWDVLCFISASLSSDSYVHVNVNRIVFTDWYRHAVYCYTMNGEKLWQFNETNALKCPKGVTTDKDGNVFVSDERSNNIVAISPDGKQSRAVLNKEDGLVCPIGLYYDISMDKLLVANKSSAAYIFQVK